MALHYWVCPCYMVLDHLIIKMTHSFVYDHLFGGRQLDGYDCLIGLGVGDILQQLHGI